MPPPTRDFDGRDAATTGSPDASPRHDSRDAPPVPASGGAFEDLDNLFPVITPGYIISTLSPERAREIGSRSDVEPELLSATANPSRASRELMKLLNDQELRKLAKLVGMPTDGKFIDLYHRLALLC